MQQLLIHAFLIIGGVGVFAAIGTYFARKLVKNHIDVGHNDVLISHFVAAGMIYAVLIGFQVVAVWQDYIEDSDNIVAEASNLVSLYRLTESMRTEHGEQVRDLLRDYVDDVVNDEWPTLLTAQHGSSKAHEPIGELYRSFGKMSDQVKTVDASINSEFLVNLTTLVEEQNKRLLHAKESMPWIIWMGAIGGALVVITMSFSLYMNNQWLHILITSTTAMLIGMMIYMIFLLEHPFAGPLALQATPFIETLKVFDQVDGGD